MPLEFIDAKLLLYIKSSAGCLDTDVRPHNPTLALMETSATPSTKRRLQYSYLKCTYCRKDKQKCEPPDRQWPSEKCDRCQQKGLPCSPSLKTDGTPGIEPIGGIQGFEPRPLPIQVQNCALAMNWLRLLWRIVREAGNEARSQRAARAVARPTSLENLVRGVKIVETFVSSMVSSALKQAVVCGDKSHEALLIRLALQGTEVQRMQEGSPWAKIAEAYSENSASERPFVGLESILSTSVDALARSEEWVAAMDTKKELLHMILNRIMNEATKLSQQRLKQLLDNTARVEGQTPIATIQERIELEKEATKYGNSVASQQAQENLSKEASSLVTLHRRFQSALEALLTRAGPIEPLPDELIKPVLHDPVFLKGPDSGLLDAIASVDVAYLTSTDSLGRTFLHLACDPPSPRAVKKILHYGVQVNAGDVYGRTALHVACKATSHTNLQAQVRSSNNRFMDDQREVISLLLGHSEIDIYLKDGDGLFAIEPALRNGRLEIATYFQNCAHFRADTELGQMLAEAQKPIQIGKYDSAWDRQPRKRYEG
ncbi:hypothetical protein F4679DRAFT_281532 [Xylaria curta]|nr:hypothetical protein F4679DRAFT_281532 [Xylaria curta]